jgi:hypothetical protein
MWQSVKTDATSETCRIQFFSLPIFPFFSKIYSQEGWPLSQKFMSSLSIHSGVVILRCSDTHLFQKKAGWIKNLTLNGMSLFPNWYVLDPVWKRELPIKENYCHPLKEHFRPYLPFTDFNFGGLTRCDMLNTSLIWNKVVFLPVMWLIIFIILYLLHVYKWPDCLLVVGTGMKM